MSSDEQERGASGRRHRDRPNLAEELIDAVRAYQTANARLDSAMCEGLGIGRTDLRCLDTLQRLGTVAAGRLAEEIGVTTGAMTGILDRMERNGYVRRVADPGDRRRVLVETTGVGFEESRRYWGPPADRFEQWLARRSEEDLRLLIEYNRVWIEAVAETVPDPGGPR